MRYIKSFKSFIKEGSLPNISIDINDILEPLEKQVDLFTSFQIDPDSFDIKTNISNLYKNVDFNKFLDKKKLKKGKLENTKDNQTLLDDKYIMSFFFVYDKGDIEIEEPKFIFIQYYHTDNKTLSEIKVFENNNNIKDFYRKLTDTNIELMNNDKSYIYTTSNSGNNWELKNIDMVEGDFKSSLDFEEMNKLLKNDKIKINR